MAVSIMLGFLWSVAAPASSKTSLLSKSLKLFQLATAVLFSVVKVGLG